jgi:transcription factor RLM1
MKSIHTPVSSRASSLAAHFDTSRSQYERTQPLPPRSHSVDSAQPQQQIIPGNMPLSNSPPPITTTTPGSISNHSAGTGQRPKLSLHIPDDEDPSQQAEESGGSATPGSASPEVNRQDNPDNIKSEHSNGSSAGERRHSTGETFFLPPPTSASSLLPTSRLPGPGLGAFDSNNSGGTPLSALPSRYAGDLLPSPSTFYPEFYGSLPSAGTSNIRSGFGGVMNGTPVVARADEAGIGFGGGFGGNGGGKRQGEELQGTNKRARN